jgi:hypothetical protein
MSVDFAFTLDAGSVKLNAMESKLAMEAERQLVEATQRLSPQERLNAMLEHCRLVAQLYEAGQEMRSLPSFQKT